MKIELLHSSPNYIVNNAIKYGERNYNGSAGFTFCVPRMFDFITYLVVAYNMREIMNISQEIKIHVGLCDLLICEI